MLEAILHQSVTDLVCAALSDLGHPDRIRADTFLVSSLVAEFVRAKNEEGLTVTASSLLHQYMHLWSYRPCCELVRARLAKLAYHTNTRRKYCVWFRQQFSISLGNFKPPRAMSRVDIDTSVLSLHGLPPSFGSLDFVGASYGHLALHQNCL